MKIKFLERYKHNSIFKVCNACPVQLKKLKPYNTGLSKKMDGI